MTDAAPLAAHLQDVVAALADVDTDAAQGALEEMGREGLAETLWALDYCYSTLQALGSEAQRLLALLMEHDTEQVGSFRLQRSRRRTEEWDGAAARSDALVAIRNRLALDVETGELVPGRARVVEEAVTLAYSVTSTAPKAKLLVTGLRALGLRAEDYRQVTEDGPWSVKVAEVAP